MTFAPSRAAEPRHHIPTGRPSWPRVLVSGPTNSWKSARAIELSADPRINHMYVVEIGDGQDTADEYGVFPRARYEIIDHDGTFLDIHDQLVAHYYLALEAEKAGQVVALTVDDMGGLNDMLTDLGDARARGKRVDEDIRNGGDGATYWSADYDATISPELRSLIKKRHGQIMRIVHNWPGPVVLLSPERMATVFVNGQPTARQDWWLECRKDLPGKVSAHVRLAGAGPAVVVKLRSGRFFNEPSLVVPFEASNFTVATLIFDWIGCEAGVSRAPADRQFDADQDMPDEVRVDRAGNRVNTGTRPAVGTRTPQQQATIDEKARGYVTWTLEPGDVDTAAQRATELAAHVLRDQDILRYVKDDERERLGVAPSVEMLALSRLGELAVEYVGRHKQSPLTPLGAGPAPDPAPAAVGHALTDPQPQTSGAAVPTEQPTGVTDPADLPREDQRLATPNPLPGAASAEPMPDWFVQSEQEERDRAATGA